MAFTVVVGLIVVIGGVFSYVAVRCETIAAKSWFRYGGLLTWLLLLLLLATVCGKPAIENVLAALISAVFWFLFLASFMGNTIVQWARGAVSLDDIKVKPGYSQVETDIRRGRHEDALKQLSDIAAAHPLDPEPWRRRADLLLKLERIDDAVRAYREAAGRTEHPDDRAMILFAMTETMVDRKNDVTGAIAVLEGFVLEFPDCRTRPYADKRLQNLRSRATQ